MSISFEIREETDLELLLPVRWRNLYPGMEINPSSSRHTDILESTIHFVAVSDDTPVGCVTLAEEHAHDRALRMRWIGVDDNYRGQGIGSALCSSCLREATRRHLGIWCNARLHALSMYKRLGFEQIGHVFEIPDIGPHLVMRTP